MKCINSKILILSGKGGVGKSTLAVHLTGALTERGLIRRIQPSGSVSRYEFRTGDNHHHVVCRACGVIADVDCAIGEAPCLTPSEDHGFALDEAEVIFWGLCPDCLSKAPT